METEQEKIARYLNAGGKVTIDEELCHCGEPEKTSLHTLTAEECGRAGGGADGKCIAPEEHHPFVLTYVTLRVKVKV